MTTHWCDFQNADVIMNIGSNSVENHPVSAKWLNKAHDRGAKWIVVDPRYTRTAEMADIYCPIRPGTDIAFYGGLYNYIIENDLWQHEYVLNYTNASYLLDPGFTFDPATGLFSGWSEETGTYDVATWHYQVESEQEWDTSEGGAYAWAVAEGVPEFTPPLKEVVKRDETLQDPMCVWQQFKQHYSRYDMDTVCYHLRHGPRHARAGLLHLRLDRRPRQVGRRSCTPWARPSITYGAQNTRAMSDACSCSWATWAWREAASAALRGEPNVQGATDMGMLVNELPGYLKWPNTTGTLQPCAAWLRERDLLRRLLHQQAQVHGLGFLKEWFGASADGGQRLRLRLAAQGSLRGGRAGLHASSPSFELMSSRRHQGLLQLGHEPLPLGAQRQLSPAAAMANLDWLVVVDQVATEASTLLEGSRT